MSRPGVPGWDRWFGLFVLVLVLLSAFPAHAAGDSDVREVSFVLSKETVIQPATAVFMLGVFLSIFSLPLRNLLIPLLATCVFITYSERVVAAGITFDMRRLVMIALFVRLWSRGELILRRFNDLDRMFFWWAGVMAVAPLFAGTSGVGTVLGFLMDSVMAYIVLKSLLQDEGSLLKACKVLVLLSVPICGLMLLERRLETNFLHYLGTPPDVQIREGEARAQAAFEHPILAGTFGAILFFLAVMLYREKEQKWLRRLAVVGMGTSVMIVSASKSSGPLYALIFGWLGLGLWFVRQHIATIRRTVWAGMVAIHLGMLLNGSGPIWTLLYKIPDRLGFVAGSTSYFRSALIDAAVTHFGQWCFFGTSIDNVATWFWGAQDLANEFVFIAVSCGFLGLLFFIMVLVRAFRYVGMRVKRSSLPPLERWTAWVLGCTVFAEIASFFSVSYFSGFWLYLYLTIALISRFCDPYRTDDVETEGEPGTENDPQEDGSEAADVADAPAPSPRWEPV